MVLAVLTLLSLSLLAALSASGRAFKAVDRGALGRLASSGDSRAIVACRLQDTRGRVDGVVGAGVAFLSILAASSLTAFCAGRFGDEGLFYAVPVSILAVLLCGWIVPDWVAARHAMALARISAFPIHVLSMFCVPVLRMAGRCGVGSWVLSEGESGLEGLRGAIGVQAPGGEERHERRMLRSILDLGDVEVCEIMVHRSRVMAIDGGQSTEAILEQITACPFTRLPVWLGAPDNIVGLLHSKALLRALREHDGVAAEIDIAALLTPPWFIPDSTSLLEQLQAFLKRREHFALVVDEYGALQGVVTLEDIIEEIVGDIADEHDIVPAGAHAQLDGSVVVAGDMTIRDLNRDYDWSLPDEDAATLAGLVLYESRAIPSVGQSFLFHGFRFTILRRLRNRITLIKVWPPTVTGGYGSD
ncbi:MAG: transporter associated domain-containing protein [Rhodospirillaceae bacterium]|nr:transporter associated domain-containing protein [Rhodospirillaceae bacterium]